MRSFHKLLILVLFVSNILCAQKPIYKDPKAPTESRIKDLISRMTRLGIPAILGASCIHGQMAKNDLKLWDANMNFVLEPGKFDVYVGASTEDIRLSGEFEVL